MLVTDDLSCCSTSYSKASTEIGTAKFSLVKQYAALFPSFTPEQRQHFRSNSFWHLKAAIPAPELLSANLEETRSFVDLVFMADGDIHAPSTSAIASLPTSDRFLGAAAINTRGVPFNISARYCIIVGLVQLLNAETMGLVDLAYHTLRALLAVSADLMAVAPWPSVLRDQINLLGRSPIVAKVAPSHSLSHLCKIVAVTPSTTHERWVTELSSFLAAILGKDDEFFLLARPVFLVSSAYASRLLPHLVKALLLPTVSSPNGDSLTLPKPIISDYLRSILQQPTVTVEIKRSVIDIVLHLRYFMPHNASTPLAYNDWLELDYLLLADAAIRCRAYSTALLFLELRHESDPNAGGEIENQILYEIYTNVEDPDGFYGIKSSDVRSSLVRRFHHERQWDRAFAYHGADLRYGGYATDDQASAVSGALQSLHSFGFDGMAMALFDQSRAGLHGSQTMTTTTVPDDLGFDLGWRTGNWDLPVDLSSTSPGIKSSEASLYAALKAVHRERDPPAVERTVRAAIVSELSSMRTLGIESMTELREIKTTLLCLREVERWSRRRLGSELGSGGGAEEVQPFASFGDKFPYVLSSFWIVGWTRVDKSNGTGAHDVSLLFCSNLAFPFSFDAIEKIEAVRFSLLDSIPFDDLDALSDGSKLVQQIRKSSQLRLSGKPVRLVGPRWRSTHARSPKGLMRVQFRHRWRSRMSSPTSFGCKRSMAWRLTCFNRLWRSKRLGRRMERTRGVTPCGLSISLNS